MTLPHLVEKIVIQNVGHYIIVYGFSGITIQWDGHTGVYVHMAEEFKGKTCGLCGDFNGNPDDDFVTLAGNKVSSVTNFGEICPDASPEQQIFPCEKASSQEMTKIQETCELLLKSPFSRCHQNVDPSLFIKMCEEDACSRINYTSINTTSCEAFTQYSRACARNGIETSWRDELNICCKYKYNRE